MGAAGSTVYYNLSQRHPTLDMPIIDYDLALLFQPMLMLGISIGVAFNVIFADWMVTVLLIILFIGTSAKASCKGVDTWKKESMLKMVTLSFHSLDFQFHFHMQLYIFHYFNFRKKLNDLNQNINSPVPVSIYANQSFIIKKVESKQTKMPAFYFNCRVFRRRIQASSQWSSCVIKSTGMLCFKVHQCLKFYLFNLHYE